MTSIEERAAKGAALLDRKRPGWAAEIDTEDFTIGSYRRCVLGQLYGDYCVGRDLVFRVRFLPFISFNTLGRAVGHGFTSTWGGIAPLDVAWLAEIRARTAPRSEAA